MIKDFYRNDIFLSNSKYVQGLGVDFTYQYNNNNNNSNNNKHPRLNFKVGFVLHVWNLAYRLNGGILSIEDNF